MPFKTPKCYTDFENNYRYHDIVNELTVHGRKYRYGSD